MFSQWYSIYNMFLLAQQSLLRMLSPYLWNKRIKSPWNVNHTKKNFIGPSLRRFFKKYINKIKKKTHSLSIKVVWKEIIIVDRSKKIDSIRGDGGRGFAWKYGLALAASSSKCNKKKSYKAPAMRRMWVPLSRNNNYPRGSKRNSRLHNISAHR
jgi:hypothetical protein